MKAVSLLALLAAMSPPALAASGGAFSIRTEHPSYLLGEPIYLRISSSQARPPSLEEYTLTLGAMPLPGSQGRSGPVAADSAPGAGEVFYRPPLRLHTRSADSGGIEGPAVRPDSTRPPVFSRYARLIAQEGGLLFPKPGRYLIRLHSASAIVSDSAILNIRAPSAPADRRAFALISGNPGEYALAVYLEGGDQLKDGMAIIGALAGFRSAYTRVARFVLSSDWSQDYTDYRGGASRPADLEKALASAQWDLKPGWYIPLRTAYRLRNAVGEVAARDTAAPGLAEVRGRLKSFETSLTPEAKALLLSF